jgi:hypothetical protein
VVSSYPPILRVQGQLRDLDKIALEADFLQELLLQLCPPHALERFQAERNAECAARDVWIGKTAVTGRDTGNTVSFPRSAAGVAGLGAFVPARSSCEPTAA